MKKQILLSVFALFVAVYSNAQTKKDGTPDMRYKANQSSYSTPSYNYNTSPSVRQQSGYVKSNGTYVEPHYKTNINSTNTDNLSTKPNYNYYNNTTGTRAQDYSSGANNYGQGQTIETGSKGGQYYINSSGNKIYVPKRTGY